MPYTLTYTRGPRMAVAEVSGLAFIDEAGELVARIEQATRLHGDTCLLIDLEDVVGTLEPQDHRLLGELAAVHLGHLKKVASFVPEEKITRISEAAANKRGVQLRVFGSLTDAIEWLTA